VAIGEERIATSTNRPTCCAAARTCEALLWFGSNDWSVFEKRREEPGWVMVLSFDAPDTGCSPEPEWGRVEFCPFCGNRLPTRTT
jgi:hypothetical protein